VDSRFRGNDEIACFGQITAGFGYIQNIADFSIKQGLVHTFVTRFTADIKTNKGSFSIKAEGADGFPIGGSMKLATERACKDFAEKLSDSLKK
jgi:hypothetical protein